MLSVLLRSSDLMVGVRRNWDNFSLLIYDLRLTGYLIKNVSFFGTSNDDNYEQVFRGETIYGCECWGLILLGETLDGKLILLLLSIFSGNSSMLFRVTTLRFCFLVKMWEATFLVENSASSKVFLFWDIDRTSERCFSEGFYF